MIKFVIENFQNWKSEVIREDADNWIKCLDSLGITYYIIEKQRNGKYKMINPKWFIEDFHPNNSFDKLADEAKRQGYEVYAEKYLPMEDFNFTEIFDKDDIVITQTSISLAIQIQERTNWKPGPWLTSENYECVKYYPILKQDNIPLLNGEGEFHTKSYVETFIENLVDRLGEKESNRLFIRPSSGLKPFTGMVFIYNENWWSNDWFWVNSSCKPTDMLLVAKPLGYENRVIHEWRFIAADGEIITGSHYSESDYTSEIPKEALELAIKTAKVYQPDPMYTVDICQTADGKYYVMELNSFSCAGLYGCDFNIVVKKIIEIVNKNYE